MKKVVLSIILIGFIIMLFNYNVFANVVDYGKSSGIDFNQYQGTGENSTTLNDKAGNIIGIISTIGIVVSVIALIALGIKYMLGSVEEKAEYKKTMIPYLIGAFLVFTVSLVPEIIYQIMQNLN